jgi:RNA polymerase sigma-70 factor (ECF subfamily)
MPRRDTVDIQTFEREMLKIERLLYRVSWSMLSNQDDCADAVQEALAKAWKNRHTLRNVKAFRNWLVRILHHVCLDMLRKRQRQRVLPLEDDALASLANDNDDFSLMEMLHLLSPEHRTAVVLHYVERYRIRDIAQMLDTPVGTVKRQLMQARLYLRKALGPQAELDGGIEYEQI